MAIKNKGSPSTRRVATTRATKARGSEAPAVATAGEHPIDSAVDKIFENNARVRAATARNLKARGEATLEIAGMAKAAFANFTPSKYSAEERERRNFVAANADTAVVQRAVVDKGVESMRTTATRRALKVHVGGALDKMIRKGDGSAESSIAVGELMDYLARRIEGPIITNTAAMSECRAEREAQRRLDDVLGETEVPEVPAPTPAATTPATAVEVTADALVNAQVQTQMSTATSPEERLRYAVASRSGTKETGKAIETFELRAGPADVTSYHDFNHLQIAFEHVWTEIFDGKLAKLGTELFHEYVKLQEFIGVPADDRNIDTIDDLRQLMAEIRELSRLTTEATPAQLQPGGEGGGSTAASGEVTTEAIVDVVQTVLDPASVVTDAIGDETVAAILNPAGAIIGAIADLIKGTPQIRWASFPGPLPGNGDLISVTVQQNAAPAGVVEIALVTDAQSTRGWKGITFREYDGSQTEISKFTITNDSTDPNVWDKSSYNVLPLYTPQVNNAILEFFHEGLFGVRYTRCYVMGALNEKIVDRSRVTFTWLKD
jgi:hypothetical protein